MSEQREEKPQIEVEGRVKATPRVDRVRGGKLVAHLEIMAGKVVIDGREANAEQHKWQRISLWGVDAKRAPENYPQGTKVSVVGDREVKTWEGDKGPRVSEEIHNARIEVIEKAKNEPGQRVEFTGTLAYRPELQQTKSGQDYVRLSVDSDEGRRENVVLWAEKAADAADRMKKGVRVRVEGERVSRPYEKGGEMVEYFEIQKAKVEDLGLDSRGPTPVERSRDVGREQSRDPESTLDR